MLAVGGWVIVACVVFGFWWSRQWPRNQGTLMALRERVAAGPGVVDFAALAPFEWTRLEVFEPYTTKEIAERRLGFSWPYKWSAVEVLDDRQFLVFLDSTRIVTAFEVRASLAHLVAPAGSFTPQSARFVIEGADGAFVLRSTEPVFETDLWPGEGIPIIEAATDSLRLYASPRAGLAPVAVRATRPGERIRFDSTRYVGLESIIFSATADSISGRHYGSTRYVRRDDYYGGGRDTTISAVAGAPMAPELLLYRAEGECFVRLRGLVLAADCPQNGVNPAALKTLWWAWTSGSSGAGWFLVSDSTARIVDRRF